MMKFLEQLEKEKPYMGIAQEYLGRGGGKDKDRIFRPNNQGYGVRDIKIDQRAGMGWVVVSNQSQDCVLNDDDNIRLFDFNKMLYYVSIPIV